MKSKDELTLSRRSFLAVGSIVATATISGCTSSDSGANYEDSYIVPQNDLRYNNNTEIKFSTGPYNCGSRCLHKFHIRNGRVLRMTSDGDIPRIDSAEEDEFAGNEAGKYSQQRSCVRGYAYIQHNYQPNRIKYPLKQTIARGRVDGFKRITWEEAMEEIANAIVAAVNRRDQYGYLPTFGTFERVLSAIVPDHNYYMNNNRDHSTGGVASARYDAVGMPAYGNTRADRFNTKFLICWALDPSRTTYYQSNALWMHTRIKEKGTPIVVLSSSLSDSASMSGTGITVNAVNNPAGGIFTYQYSKSTSVKIPRWVAVRPATDGALTVAMMYILWKNKLHDIDYLKSNSFGFFKNTSTYYEDKINKNDYTNIPRLTYSPGGSGFELGFPDSEKQGITDNLVVEGFTKGEQYFNKTFKVPSNCSFEEYLESLETTWHAIDPMDVGTNMGTDSQEARYRGIIDYAARLTGVKPEYIEALAFGYAEPYLSGRGAAMIDMGGGAQRAYNGTESAWLQFCLPAMCGYSDKSGGSNGINMMASIDDGLVSSVEGSPAGVGTILTPVYGAAFSVNGINAYQIPCFGTDGRTAEQIVADILHQTKGIDDSKPGLDITQFPMYSTTKPLHMEVIGNFSNSMTTLSNINRNIYGMIDPSVKLIYTEDNVMTPMAAYSDIVLPRATHFEQNTSIQSGCGNPVRFLAEKLCEPQYDAMTQADFQAIMGNKLRYKLGAATEEAAYTPPSSPSTEEEIKKLYDNVKITDLWLRKYGSTEAVKPSYETFRKTGKIDFLSPSSNPMIGFRDGIPIGKFYNSTGLINFFSPFWYIRMRSEISGGTRGAVIDPSLNGVNPDGSPRPAGPSGPYYSPGWRTETVRYLPALGGYEQFFKDNDPRKEFTGYISANSNRTYKLMYLTHKARNRAHTVLDGTAVIRDQFPQTVKINPIDAAGRGINDGEMVYVYNDRGCTYIPAELTIRTLPGVITIEHGAWYRAHPTEKVTVWMKNRLTGLTTQEIVPVDIGGAENMLTDDDFVMDTVFNSQSMAAQTGPCEISKIKPE